ncbi:MAG: DivIVA protein [Actinomycetota bacterium]
MFTPSDIEARDFPVTIDGYHRGEVRAFLAAVAECHAEALRRAQAFDPDSPDAFAHVGAEIADVLRAAKEAAATMTAEGAERLRVANDEATEVLAAAARDADELLTAAESIRVESVDEAAVLRAQATATVEAAQRDADAARVEAERILEDARSMARHITEETERQRNEVEAATRDRLSSLATHEATIRDRLWQLNESVRTAGALLADGEVDVPALH